MRLIGHITRESHLMRELPRSYVLCGTPRTGSTLLCSLLCSTGILGRPESYFREPDEVAWATRFVLATEGGRVRDYRAFVNSALSAGTSENGVFGARIMWGSLERMIEGLGRVPWKRDLLILEEALGPLTFVHLQREDIAAQAVSWCRAEQTGYWQQGDAVTQEPYQDTAQTRLLMETIREHNAAWRAWFDAQGVEPHTVTYEQLVSNRRCVVQSIAAELSVELPSDWRPQSPHRKQADGLNRAWADVLRTSVGR
jgi:trehalose 2-sulfotransferase